MGSTQDEIKIAHLVAALRRSNGLLAGPMGRLLSLPRLRDAGPLLWGALAALVLCVAASAQHLPARAEGAAAETLVSLSPLGIWPLCQGSPAPAFCSDYTPGSESWVLLVKSSAAGVASYAYQVRYVRAGVTLEARGVALRADDGYGWTAILLPLGLIDNGWAVTVQALAAVGSAKAEGGK